MNRSPRKDTVARRNSKVPPYKRTFQCNRFLCAYENPPQVAPGSYGCRAVYSGRPCTGSYRVSRQDADDFDNYCLEQFEEQAKIKERIRHAHELRRRKDEQHLKEWREERAVYERFLSSDGGYDLAAVSKFLTDGGRRAVLERQGNVQWASQTRWMQTRMEELDDLIANLQEVMRADVRKPKSPAHV